MHITNTLQLLGGSSEAGYHAQALSTAEHKHKLSLPLSAEVSGLCLHIRSSTVNSHWAKRDLREEGRSRPGNLGGKNSDFSCSLLNTFRWTFTIWSKWTPKEINLWIINGPLIELLTSGLQNVNFCMTSGIWKGFGKC